MNVELKRIAEKKIEQLGGDVCGVLVRKDGKLAAVDEHGRVQWLQDDGGEYAAYLEGMNSHLKAELEAARAQSGQGAEAVVDIGTQEREGFWQQPIDKYTQPAQQGSLPDGWRLTHIDDPETDGYIIRGPGVSYCAWKDKEPWLYLFCEALATTPQPEGDGWVRCDKRDPCERDGYKVWFSPDGIIRRLIAPSVLAESTRKQGYWKPTGLKRPQPPTEDE